MALGMIPETDLTASQFLTLSIAGIICLTPLAVYLIWVVTINRKDRPTVVSGVWDFVAMLFGLAGFLFTLGAVLAGIATDAAVITGGKAANIPDRMPWLTPIGRAVLGGYLLVMVLLILKGLRGRRDTLAVYNADAVTVDAELEAVFARSSVDDVERRGAGWYRGSECVVDTSTFPTFRHTVIALRSNDVTARQEQERILRNTLPRQTAAAHNPAVQWISTVMTCSIVAVGCCVILIFAVPFVVR
ncbi:hypothetical protein BH11PLA2_BH11PLA2_49960 [soil metagenome]